MNEIAPDRRWLHEWPILDLRQTNWWIGDFLRRCFPEDICRTVEAEFLDAPAPLRWRALGSWGPIGDAARCFTAAAESAERAELQLRMGKGPWRGKRLILDQLLRSGLAGDKYFSETKNREFTDVAIRYNFVRFWIVGPTQLPDRLPLAICSDRALNDLIDWLGIRPKSGLDEGTLGKIRRRLNLKPGTRRSRWIAQIEHARDGGGRHLKPVWGGDAANPNPRPSRTIGPCLHPRTFDRGMGWGTALPIERLRPMVSRLVSAGWSSAEISRDFGLYSKTDRKVRLQIVAHVRDKSLFWLFQYRTAK